MTSSSSYTLVACILLTASILVICVHSSALNYDPSKTYSYLYHTDILLNDANSKKSSVSQQDVGAKIIINFNLATIYKDQDVQMFKLSITKASLSGATTQAPVDLLHLLSVPAIFQLSNNLVSQLYLADESSFSRNIKKGIIGLFQVQDNAGERTEVDVSGECLVKYTNIEPGVIDRTKADCQNLEIAGQFSTRNKALGVSVYSKSSTQYHLKNSVIERATGTHRVITYLNIRPSLNGGATSSQSLLLESVVVGSPTSSSAQEALDKAQAEVQSSYTKSLLPSEEEIQQCTEKCQTPESLLSKLAEDLKAENLATLKSAKAFTQLLKSVRVVGKETLTKLMTSPDSYYVVPQLIDIVTAAQTEASQRALFELLDFQSESSIEHPQRFLFAAAYSSHPSESLIADLLSVLKNPLPSASLRESVLLSLGAIVHTFCQVVDQCQLTVVEEFKNILRSDLANCEDEPCRLMYVRALGNAGLPETVADILPLAESPASPMLAATAISAFRRIPAKFISAQVKESLLRIFHQNKATYDASVRLSALEFILDKSPSDQELRNIILSAVDQSEPEFSTYVINLLLDAASVYPTFAEQLTRVLQDRQLNNYNLWAQRGKSSVLTSYLAKMKDVNTTYNLFFENSASGVMKRSGMLVSLIGKSIHQPFLKFGIYADGLDALMGQEAEAAPADTDDSQEETSAVEPTAGMSFTFMDVLLTQVEFFRGTAGLMSAAWNAPSELTSALQGNILLQDHSQKFHLSNGLVLDTDVTGVLSMDLSGYVSISLWNRNCEALIRNSGAIYLEGSMQLNSALLNLGLSFSGEAQSNIDFTSNADFYQMPLKLCMQMKRPEFEFLQMFQKREQINKGKTKKFQIKTKSKSSGESYFLNKANSDECRIMITED